jgi:ubiquinone/menaquinone biosynthesis C-methylase UbiE
MVSVGKLSCPGPAINIPLKYLIKALRHHLTDRNGDNEMQPENTTLEKPIDTREWYNFVAMLTDALPHVHPGGDEATQMLLELLPLESAGRILDAGCGPGGTACHIAQQHTVQVFGVDIAEIMIEQARKRAQQMDVADRVDFRVADLFHLPFVDEFFDGVLLESVLTPLPGDKEQALLELRRVVKPGGWIAANEAVIDPTAPANFMDAMREHPAFHGYFTRDSLRGLFERAGLRVTHFQELPQADAPDVMKELGCRGLISFMLMTYPRLAWRLLRDADLRKVQRLDERITKQGQEYTGGALIVGEKR